MKNFLALPLMEKFFLLLRKFPVQKGEMNLEKINGGLMAFYEI